jgi:glutathione synthase
MPKRSLKLLFVADPLSRFDSIRETTLWIMHEAVRRGHKIYATTPQGLSARGLNIYANAEGLKSVKPGKKLWYQSLGSQWKDLRSFDAVLLRKDPPFDTAYLHHLLLLDLIAEEVYMMNHPRGILLANEKVFPMLFPECTPDTLVSADFQELYQFIKKHPDGTVIKPLDSSGGRGVFILRNEKSDNLGVILETATQDFTRHTIAQAYAPVHRTGDKRVMVLDQEILGVFVRKPTQGEHRANLHSGGSAHPTQLTRRDKEIVSRLSPQLEALGCDFVGLDIIGDYLIEVNLTSPMGLYELNQSGYRSSQSKVVDFIEKRVK